MSEGECSVGGSGVLKGQGIVVVRGWSGNECSGGGGDCSGSMEWWWWWFLFWVKANMDVE